MSGSTPTVPAQEGARPEAGGPGAGAAGSPVALEVPRVKCEELYYRHNIKAAGRTRYIVIDTGRWEILKPTRVERSRTGAHGVDIYCLEESAWDMTMVVRLERSNSGKLRYGVEIPHAEYERYRLELEALLALATSFSEMEETIAKYVSMRRIIRG